MDGKVTWLSRALYTHKYESVVETIFKMNTSKARSVQVWGKDIVSSLFGGVHEEVRF